MPMKHFTPILHSEEPAPSERTLKVIRQIAHTYRAIKFNGKTDVFCLS